MKKLKAGQRVRIFNVRLADTENGHKIYHQDDAELIEPAKPGECDRWPYAGDHWELWKVLQSDGTRATRWVAPEDVYPLGCNVV